MPEVVPLLFAASMASAGSATRIVVGIVSALTIGAYALSVCKKMQVQLAPGKARPAYSYRGGPNPDLPEDPWTFLTPDKIDRALYRFSCEEGVKGYDEAIEVLRDEL